MPVGKSERPPNGEAFGFRRRDWSQADTDGHELADPFDVNLDLRHGLAREAWDEVDDFPFHIALLVGALYRKPVHSAHALIITGATNDVIALVQHVERLDGRSAAHAARALFEHLVNLHDVVSSTVNTADRYVAHQYVIQDHIAKHRDSLALLRDGDLKKERDRLDRIGRKAKAPLNAALAIYDKSFGRQWATGTLADRAKMHGLDAGYEGYQILSSLVHGSSGSLAGVTRQISGRRVHRTGPDLDLASMSYFEGLTTFRLFAAKLVETTEQWEAQEMADRASHLLLSWPLVRKALQRIDIELWPTEAPPGPLAIVAFYPNGHRWFYYHPKTETVTVADPPDPEPDLSRFIAERATTYSAARFNGRPLTVVCTDVRVNPKSGMRPFPASAILVPAGHPARRTDRFKESK